MDSDSAYRAYVLFVKRFGEAYTTVPNQREVGDMLANEHSNVMDEKSHTNQHVLVL